MSQLYVLVSYELQSFILPFFKYERVLQAPKIDHDSTIHFCDIPRLQLTRAGTTYTSTLGNRLLPFCDGTGEPLIFPEGR
jgi:hypothetical protein